MATVTLVDFEDIYTAIHEELKVQLTDGTTLGRTKRDINMIYLNHIIPFKPSGWWWLKKEQDVQTHAKITTGTITIVDDSTTVTFSSAPAVSVANYYLKVQGYDEVIEITAHTAAATTATLKSAWRRGNITAQSFVVWKDFIALDSDMKETTLVTHEKMGSPMDAVNYLRFKDFRVRQPDFNGYPTIYTTEDFDSDGSRLLRWYPACDTTRHTLHVTGVQEATRLSDDADEPLMPVEDRIAIFYGACARGWARQGNEARHNTNWGLFQDKLKSMAGKTQDAPMTTQLQTDTDYLLNKRYRRMFRGRRSAQWRKD
jgi:hypothetical protein